MCHSFVHVPNAQLSRPHHRLVSKPSTQASCFLCLLSVAALITALMSSRWFYELFIKLIGDDHEEILLLKKKVEEEANTVLSLYSDTKRRILPNTSVIIGGQSVDVITECENVIKSLSSVSVTERVLNWIQQNNVCVVSAIWFIASKFCTWLGLADENNSFWFNIIVAFVAILVYTCIFLFLLLCVLKPKVEKAIREKQEVLKKYKEAVIELLQQKMELVEQEMTVNPAPNDLLQSNEILERKKLEVERLLNAWRATDGNYLNAFLSATKYFFEGMSMEDVNADERYTGDNYSSMYTIAKALADYLKRQLHNNQNTKTIVSNCKSADPIEGIRVEMPEEFVQELRTYMVTTLALD